MRKPASTGRPEGDRVCNYYRVEGHWKVQCPLLKSKVKHHLPSHAPAMLCSAVSDKVPVCVNPSEGLDVSVKTPFIADAVMSLVGSDKHVPIEQLRDTGAKHSFILESVLLFSSEMETGDFILMKGMALGLNPVLCHFIVLDCQLVEGIVPVGVCPWFAT